MNDFITQAISKVLIQLVFLWSVKKEGVAPLISEMLQSWVTQSELCCAPARRESPSISAVSVCTALFISAKADMWTQSEAELPTHKLASHPERSYFPLQLEQVTLHLIITFLLNVLKTFQCNLVNVFNMIWYMHIACDDFCELGLLHLHNLSSEIELLFR